jgi:sugar phosphate isomerase/epimerase
MRIGIDSYSYHRLFGEIRRGETAPARSFAPGSIEAVRHARSLGVDAVSLETCFLQPPGLLDPAALRAEAGSMELVVAWGHRHGLEYGASEAALQSLLEWIDVAGALGCRLVRCVAASPAFRGREPVAAQVARTVRPLTLAARRAGEVGARLALENHGDLRAHELLDLVAEVDDDALGVCFDTANAVRVGDDVVAATRLLAPLTWMVHLKDVERMETVTDPVAGPRSVPYGAGVVPVAGVLDALGPRDALVCVELGQLGDGDDELVLVEQSVAWLRDYASSNG